LLSPSCFATSRSREKFDRLSETYAAFIFSKRQEELAGASGIDEFRDVFFRRSRLVVVLYRSDWGETPWTRVERTAIEERFLRDGSEFLLFVMLNSADAPPKWLPETRIRLNFDQFGVLWLLGVEATALARFQFPKLCREPPVANVVVE